MPWPDVRDMTIMRMEEQEADAGIEKYRAWQLERMKMEDFGNLYISKEQKPIK